jgi:hypothetical protein
MIDIFLNIKVLTRKIIEIVIFDLCKRILLTTDKFTDYN